MAGIKWIGSKHDNPSARGIPRASAVIVLNDPETHFPVAIMEGGEISGMRTAGVTVLACEYLARLELPVGRARRLRLHRPPARARAAGVVPGDRADATSTTAGPRAARALAEELEGSAATG